VLTASWGEGGFDTLEEASGDADWRTRPNSTSHRMGKFPPCVFGPGTSGASYSTTSTVQ
jgi:hypothetical protein